MENQFQPQILERKENEMHSINVIHEASDSFIKELLEMQDKSYPAGWQYEDAAEYYKRMIESPENINIVLKEKEKVIGYVLVIPHNDVVTELREVDPLMKEDLNRFYIETLEIVPEIQKTLAGGKLFFQMLGKLFEESGKRGINKFSMHARVSTGLSKVVQRYFGKMMTEVRQIENWPYYDGQEPTCYMLGTYEKK